MRYAIYEFVVDLYESNVVFEQTECFSSFYDRRRDRRSSNRRRLSGNSERVQRIRFYRFRRRNHSIQYSALGPNKVQHKRINFALKGHCTRRLPIATTRVDPVSIYRDTTNSSVTMRLHPCRCHRTNIKSYSEIQLRFSSVVKVRILELISFLRNERLNRYQYFSIE